VVIVTASAVSTIARIAVKRRLEWFRSVLRALKMSEVYPELDATLTYIIIRVLFSTMFVRTYLSLQVRDDGEDRRDQSGHSGRKSGRVSGIESSRGISSSGCGIDGGLEVIKVD
jgi:hypothetical protein